MKTLNYLNYFFVGVPITLSLIGIINDEFSLFALISMIATGIFQVVIGIKMLIDDPRNKHLITYICGVFTFFILWYLNKNHFRIDTVTSLLFSMPPLLALYLSVIIYKKANK